MNLTPSKRRIVETAVGAALGAAIAGPVGAVAGGVAGNAAASRVRNLGTKKAPRKKPKVSASRARAKSDLRHILVPVDFSSHSLTAIRFASDWAKRFRASVCLLHVVEPVNMSAPFGAQAVILPPPPIDYRTQAKAHLEELARKEFPRQKNVTAIVRDGVPYDSIIATAAKLKSDLIVISTHGRTGLMRVLMGSTAERVVRHAPCPVLTVRTK